MIIIFFYRFPCEVRVRSVPLTPCRRKKRQVEEPESPRGASTTTVQKSERNSDTQVQSSQVCYNINIFINIFVSIKTNCIHCRV